MSAAGMNDPLANLVRLAHEVLATDATVLKINAADPARRVKMEANLAAIRAQIGSLRTALRMLEKVDRLLTKTLRRVTPRASA